MNLLFPMMYQLCVRLLPDQSEQSVLLQKQILKIYFALTQVSIATNEWMNEWEFLQLTVPLSLIGDTCPMGRHTHWLPYTCLFIAFLSSVCVTAIPVLAAPRLDLPRGILSVDGNCACCGRQAGTRTNQCSGWRRQSWFAMVEVQEMGTPYPA